MVRRETLGGLWLWQTGTTIWDIVTRSSWFTLSPRTMPTASRAKPSAPLTAALGHEVRAATPPALRHWPTELELQLGGAIAIAALWLPQAAAPPLAVLSSFHEFVATGNVRRMLSAALFTCRMCIERSLSPPSRPPCSSSSITMRTGSLSAAAPAAGRAPRGRIVGRAVLCDWPERAALAAHV